MYSYLHNKSIFNYSTFRYYIFSNPILYSLMNYLINIDYSLTFNLEKLLKTFVKISDEKIVNV